VRADVSRLQKELGITTVYVTHDQVEAMTLGTRVAVLRGGVVQQCASPQELYRRPKNLFVAAFIGSPSMNLVEARVEAGVVRFAGHELALPAGSPLADASREVILGVRPAAFALDALAIAAQALVGHGLGADDVPRVRAVLRRTLQWGVAAGAGLGVVMAAGGWWFALLFTSDPEVRTAVAVGMAVCGVLLPMAGWVFVLDGVLIGAGDGRYMRNLTLVAALGGFLPAIWLAWFLDLGLGGVWAGLTLFIVIRLAALLLRLASGRWAVVGAERR